MNGKEVLDRIFHSHCNTVHLFKGLITRLKIKLRYFGVFLCGISFKVIRWVLKYAFGRVIKPEDYMRDVFGDYKKEDMKLDETKTINLFGYQASINVIMTFCIIVFTVYTIAYLLEYDSTYISGIGKNPFLCLVTALLFLSILDNVVPYLLFRFLNLVLNVRFKIWFYK